MIDRVYPGVDAANVRLDDEDLSEEEILRRRALGNRILAMIPREALARLQILQPAIGCLNRCNFCSQVAGPVTRELGAQSLRAVMGGLRGAMAAMNLERVGGERVHKDGVVFPYLDNDIGSYPHLIDYLVGMRGLGGRTRISTVGWSRHNETLQAMHQTVAANHADDIDGIRFSLTPYTVGWRTNREDYMSDFANALSTYRPLFEQKGVGRRTGCIEMRFAPDISLGDVEVIGIDGYTMVRCGEYGMVTMAGDFATIERSRIAAMTEDGPRLSSQGIDALHVIGDLDGLDAAAIEALFASAPSGEAQAAQDYAVLTQRGRAHVFGNTDGLYYCFNPLKLGDTNTFHAVHYYPRTDRRQQSGVLDATRPFLNNLMAMKRERGVGLRDDLPEASTTDVLALLDRIVTDAEGMRQFSPRRSEYITNHVLPLVIALVRAMDEAGLPPEAMFQYGLVIDTGVIVNQGKALSEFRGLASRPDTLLTPNEEKGYGDVSQSSVRGNTWRISPVSSVGQGQRPVGFGGKSLPVVVPTQRASTDDDLALGFYEWNPQTFNNVGPDGAQLRSLHVPVGDLLEPLQKITPEQGRRDHLLPGSERSG